MIPEGPRGRRCGASLLTAMLGLAGCLIAAAPARAQVTYTLSNTAPIQVNAATDPTGAISSTDLYPSAITFSGISPGEQIISLTVTLSGFSSTDTNALMAAIAKAGASQPFALLFDGPGSVGNPVSDLTLTFDDSSGNSLPTAGTFGSGVYAPGFVNTGYNDVLPAGNTASPANPAPQVGAASYPSGFSQFVNTDPNGTYLLFVNDFYPDSSATIANGWTLSITTNGTAPAAAAPEPGTFALIAAALLACMTAFPFRFRYIRLRRYCRLPVPPAGGGAHPQR